MNIEDFLPKYPNIYRKEGKIFNPYSKDFNESIYRKKEFYEQKLDKQEEKPLTPGNLMKHQIFIARYLSSHTLYNSLLLFHEMGTGKTCASIGAIEQIKRENSTIDGAVILAKGNTILNNFKNELVFNCTKGEYIPKNYKYLNEETRKIRMKKLYSKFYEFNTFDVFAKEIIKFLYRNDLGGIIRKYSNKVIVIDEVHNLRAGNKTYKAIHRFLHLIRNNKILLMSGTPMKDKPEEIAVVMNLILPENKQLPTGKKFISKFLEKNEDQIYILKSDKIKLLKAAFKGRVSYLRRMISNVRKIYEGKYIRELKTIKVVPDYMKNIQNRIYLEAYKKDKVRENVKDKIKSGIYSNSRQASLFVFPDGTYGKGGFDNENEKYIMTEKGFKDKRKYYVSTKTLKNAIGDYSDPDMMLRNLENYSSKYAKTIREILKSGKKSIFVYCEFVSGSGCILFSKILEMFGFRSTKGRNVTDKFPRYSIITNKTSTAGDIQNIIKRFNNRDNMYGEYIKVIIASKVAQEGLSFKNVQQIHVLTPWWDYSETEQVISRSIRAFSHKDLEEAGNEVQLDIFQHVSIPTKENGDEIPSKSIDVKMYIKSEEKDVSIKNIERIIKESAVDCALNYNRNFQPYYQNYSRDCEYKQCNYKCSGISNMNPKTLDVSTYKLYYTEAERSLLMNQISQLFRSYFSLSFSQIRLFLHDYINFEILSVLSIFINQSIGIYNKYGFKSYIREKNNIYFLVEGISTISSLSSNFYLVNPSINDIEQFESGYSLFYSEKLKSFENDNPGRSMGYINKLMTREWKIVDKQKYINDALSENFQKNFNRLINNIFVKNIPDKINKLKQSTNKEKNIIKFSEEIQEIMLENAILLKRNEEKVSDFVEWLLNHYKNFWKKIGDTYVSSLMFDNNEGLKCLENDNDTWKNCDEDLKESFKNVKKKQIQNLINKKVGYYGILDKATGEFKLRNIVDEKMIKSKDRREETSGLKCASWGREDLVQKIVFLEKGNPYPEDYLSNMSKNALVIKLKKYFEKIYPDETTKQVKKFNENDLRKILYFYERKRNFKNKDLLCKRLMDLLKKNNMLLEQ